MSINGLHRRLHSYTKERFNLWQFVPLSLSISSVLFLGVQAYSDHEFLLSRFLLAFGAIFLFLLRLRIFDEFKDYEHDLIHYSHRPVPRGLISKRELVSLLSIIISIELIIVVISGINSLLPFVISFAYSLLMFKEFFVKDWLKRNFTAYIISHEILSIPLFFYICTISGFNIYSFKAPFIWYLIVFVSITLFILEITRKFRAKEHEIPSKDTYTAQYGIMPTSFLLIVLSAFSVLIAFNILSSLYVPVSILFILPLLSLIIFIFSIYDFNMDTIPKKAKNVFIYSILFTFSFWAVMIVSFLSI